jgi:hypothetical protein
LVVATGYCGQAVARPRRSAACREKRDREGGSGRFFLFSFHVPQLGSGQRGLGSTAEDSSSMATGSRRMGIAMLTVEPISWIFAHHVFDQMPARI